MKALVSNLLHGLVAVLLALGSASAMSQASANSATAREIRWEDLMPSDWDPYKELRAKSGGGNPAAMVDGTPQAMERMREVRKIWDNAPANKALVGQAVKLPGFVVPLEETKEGLKEFLLVPYFGACIHSPPPPANQIIHVVSSKPVKFQAMDTVWVSGTLGLSRHESEMGVSGYQMMAASVTRYLAPAR